MPLQQYSISATRQGCRIAEYAHAYEQDHGAEDAIGTNEEVVDQRENEAGRKAPAKPIRTLMYPPVTSSRFVLSHGGQLTRACAIGKNGPILADSCPC